MNRKYLIQLGIFVFFIVFIINTINVNAATTTTWCYQESANTTNQSSTGTGGNPSGDGNCNLAYNGTYSGTYGIGWMDGNWSTTGGGVSNRNGYVNYTKPAYSTNASLWKIKDAVGITNLTIPNDCWNYSSINLSFYILKSATLLQNMWYCYNGTTWKNLRTADTAGFYEEAMWWSITQDSPANSCTCPSHDSNWAIAFSDNCNITSTCDLGIGNLSFTNTSGYCNISAIINSKSGFNLYDETAQTIYINGSGKIIIG